MNKFAWSFVIATLAASVSVSAQDTVRPPMSREQGEAYLRGRDADVSRSNLTAVVMGGDLDAAEALIAAGVDPNEKDRSLPQSILEMATMLCMGDRVDEAHAVAMFGLLLDRGANPNAPGMLGVMISAAQQCPPSVIKRLVKGGAKLDVRTPQGFTPLSMALIVERYDNAEALIDAGARLSAEGAKKLLADAKGNERLIKLIKRASAK
ncbi:MAG: ankyrin repeat domain-containing protein [Tahibacter sp.]